MSVMEICDSIERLITDEYDRGVDRTLQTMREGFEEELADATEAARLAGFEEGYDEAKEVFQKEGIEDVKVQAYDRGFRSGQQDGYNAAWNDARAEKELNQRRTAQQPRRLGGHGC